MENEISNAESTTPIPINIHASTILLSQKYPLHLSVSRHSTPYSLFIELDMLDDPSSPLPSGVQLLHVFSQDGGDPYLWYQKEGKFGKEPLNVRIENEFGREINGMSMHAVTCTNNLIREHRVISLSAIKGRVSAERRVHTYF